MHGGPCGAVCGVFLASRKDIGRVSKVADPKAVKPSALERGCGLICMVKATAVSPMAAAVAVFRC